MGPLGSMRVDVVIEVSELNGVIGVNVVIEVHGVIGVNGVIRVNGSHWRQWGKGGHCGQ